MDLSEYVSRLKGDSSYHEAAKETGVSTNTLHKLINGRTVRPTPDIFVKLAQAYGATKQDQRQIYANLMRLAGYMDMMPRRVWRILREEGRGDELEENDKADNMSPLVITSIIPEAQDTLKEIGELSESDQRAILGVLRAAMKMTKREEKKGAPSSYATEEITSITKMLEELPDYLLGSVSWGIRSHIRSIYETIEEEKRRARPLNTDELARLERLEEAFKQVAPEVAERQERQLEQLLGESGSKAYVEEESSRLAA